MDPSIVKLLEEDVDESMHSGADVEVFTAALNRDIGGDVDTIPGPSDSATVGISQEGAPRPNEVGEMRQTSGRNPTLGNQQIEQGKAISDQSKMVGGNPDVSTKLPISQTQTQTRSKMTNQQAQGVNSVSASKKAEKGAPTIPFQMLMPVLRPHLDKDRDMQLQQIFSKLRSNEVTKEEFLGVIRNIVGDKMLRQAAHTVHLQMQAQATKPATTPNTNSSTSTSRGATSNSNPSSATEGAPRPNEVGEMRQTSGRNPTLGNQQIEQGKAISDQSKMVGGNPDVSTKLPISQTQTQTRLKMTNQQSQGVNSVSASKKAEKGAPTIPFQMLMPVLRPHLDKDRDMQLQQFFSKLRSNEVTKEEFLGVIRNIVGDKMLRQAAHTVHLQMQAQATKPATTPNTNSSTSTSTGATSNSNPSSAPSTNPNQYSLLSQATSQQFYPGGFQAAQKVSLGQSPSPSQLQTESKLEPKGPQPMPNRPSLVSPSMQQLTRPPHQHGPQGAHTTIGMFGPSFPSPIFTSRRSHRSAPISSLPDDLGTDPSPRPFPCSSPVLVMSQSQTQTNPDVGVEFESGSTVVRRTQSRKRSLVWIHFNEVGTKAVCKHCSMEFVTGANFGTTHLCRHILVCQKIDEEERERFASGKGDDFFGTSCYKFDPELTRNLMTLLFIDAEIPINVIESRF